MTEDVYAGGVWGVWVWMLVWGCLDVGGVLLKLVCICSALEFRLHIKFRTPFLTVIAEYTPHISYFDLYKTPGIDHSLGRFRSPFIRHERYRQGGD